MLPRPYLFVCAAILSACSGNSGTASLMQTQSEVELLPEYSDWSGLMMGFSKCGASISPYFEEHAQLLRELAAVTKVRVLVDDSCVKTLASVSIGGIEVQEVGAESINLVWIRDHSLVWGRTESGLNATELRHLRSSAGGIANFVASLGASHINETSAQHVLVGGNFQISTENRCFAGYTTGFVDGFEDELRPGLLAAGCREVIRIDLPVHLKTKHLDMVFHQIDSDTVALARYPEQPEHDAVMLANKAKVEALGLRVLEVDHFSLQRPYVNVVLVGKKVFVPQYGAEYDSKALDAYRSLGLSPVGVPMEQHAVSGGAIHCSTNYFMAP